MKWVSRISVASSLDEAIAEACSGARSELAGVEPDLVVTFASPQFGSGLTHLPERLSEQFGGAVVLGCTGGGIIGDGREIEDAAALSISTASLPDVDITPLRLGTTPDEWSSHVPVDPDSEPSFILLPEPFTCNAEQLIRWFDAAFPNAVKIGGIASGAASAGGHSLFIGKRTFTDGAVGVALCGNVAVESVVAQGCRPIGIPMFATRSESNFVLELDGQPALGVLQNLFESLSPEDQALFRHSLFLGIVMRDAQQSYDRGDFLIRNIVGTDVERGAVAVAAHVDANQVVQFHLRDALTSAEDLDAALSRERASMDGPLGGALLFSCLGRGKRLYGAPDRDSAMFHGHFGGVPLGGFFCNGEIGPVQGRTFLHGYTASFGLFRPKRA